MKYNKMRKEQRRAESKRRRQTGEDTIVARIPYRPEINYVDISLSAATPSFTGQWQAASTIAPGDNDQERQGNLISPLRYSVRGLVARGAGDAYLRLIVVQLLYDAAAVTAADPLETTGSAAVVYSTHNRDFVAPNKQANRMVVLSDTTFNVDTYHPLQHFFQTFDKAELQSKTIRYLDSAGSNIPIMGALGYFVYSNVNASHPMFYATTRVDYVDS